MVLAWAAWAAVHDLELPSPKTSASDEGGLVSSLLSETVVTCSTLEKRSSSVSLRTIFKACMGVMIAKMMPWLLAHHSVIILASGPHPV